MIIYDNYYYNNNLIECSAEFCITCENDTCTECRTNKVPSSGPSPILCVCP